VFAEESFTFLRKKVYTETRKANTYIQITQITWSYEEKDIG